MRERGRRTKMRRMKRSNRGRDCGRAGKEEVMLMVVAGVSVLHDVTGNEERGVIK